MGDFDMAVRSKAGRKRRVELVDFAGRGTKEISFSIFAKIDSQRVGGLPC